jgi:hypothetical protein
MSDFVGELLNSRSLADLASRLFRIGDALRAKLSQRAVKVSPSNTAVIFFFARCFKTYQAAIELLRLGFPQDAAALARVMREAQYQAAWIVKNGDETAKLFLQDYSRNRRKAMRTVADHGDPKVQKKAQEVVAATAPDEVLDEWWRNWWGKKHNIAWLAEQVGHKEAHRFEYAFLSAFVHTSPALLDFYFHEAKDAGPILETRPGISEENRDMTVDVAYSIFSAFANTCKLFAHQLGLGFDEELKDIDARIKAEFVEQSGPSARSSEPT